ncbi:RNase H domain-containing protein [Colletotrichum tofieldiae]|uniref:ribonuclease H n=1 Tax=Colletotrichum tofieldiae TaxID=708197 RepID=A0A166TU58_9PEZI|nr:RNase H domain-containing protein [Colletotrichum tofieldiae]
MAWPEIDYVELPNARTVTVCAPHQMVTCGKCCLDFSLDFDDDFDDDDYSGDGELFGFDFNSPVPRDVSVAQVAGSRYGRPARPAWEPLKVDDNEDMHDDEPSGLTKHSGIVFASKFDQHRATPLSPDDLFPVGRNIPVGLPGTRFINRDDTSECLIYTDGACFDNGAAGARGGCAFVFKPVYANDQSGKVAFKLEDHGPDGRVYCHTSNRAELRAVIAALRFRAWDGEGFRGIVIATDSTYVVNGATDWTRTWVKKGWRLTTDKPVKNRDLWEALLLDVEKLHDRGVKVRFWKIPRQYNHLADRAAKSAASILKPTENFTDITDFSV